MGSLVTGVVVSSKPSSYEPTIRVYFQFVKNFKFFAKLAKFKVEKKFRKCFQILCNYIICNLVNQYFFFPDSI